MAELKELRVDSNSYPFYSSHLIIRQSGAIEVIKNNKVYKTKVTKKTSFFKELDEALLLNFHMMGNYKKAKNYYHISIINDDGSEESHFYTDDFESNNQGILKSVLEKYIPEEFLIDCITGKYM